MWALLVAALVVVAALWIHVRRSRRRQQADLRDTVTARWLRQHQYDRGGDDPSTK